jgi:hypothetical protein
MSGSGLIHTFTACFSVPILIFSCHLRLCFPSDIFTWFQTKALYVRTVPAVRARVANRKASLHPCSTVQEHMTSQQLRVAVLYLHLEYVHTLNCAVAWSSFLCNVSYSSHRMLTIWHSGSHMYHLLWHSLTLHFSRRVCLCVSCDSAIIFLNSINQLIFIMGKCCVFFAEGTHFFKFYVDELRLPPKFCVCCLFLPSPIYGRPSISSFPLCF